MEDFKFTLSDMALAGYAPAMWGGGGCNSLNVDFFYIFCCNTEYCMFDKLILPTMMSKEYQ